MMVGGQGQQYKWANIIILILTLSVLTHYNEIYILQFYDRKFCGMNDVKKGMI